MIEFLLWSCHCNKWGRKLPNECLTQTMFHNSLELSINSPILISISYIQFNGEHLLKSTRLGYGIQRYYTNIIAIMLSVVIFGYEYSEFIPTAVIVNHQWQECFHCHSGCHLSYYLGLGSRLMLNIHRKCLIMTQNQLKCLYNSKIYLYYRCVICCFL